MLEILKRKGKTLEKYTLRETILKELERFDADDYIQKMYSKLEAEKKENINKFQQLKEKVEGLGFTFINERFNPEYPSIEAYGDAECTVFKLEKDGLVLDVWANGDNTIKVFDDEAFFRAMKEKAIQNNTAEDMHRYNYLRKAFYFICSLWYDKESGNIQQYDIYEKIYSYVPMRPEDTAFVNMILGEGLFQKTYRESVLFDQFPICRFAGIADKNESNWLEIFYDYKGEYLSDVGDIESAYDLFEVLEDAQAIYDAAVEYYLSEE